MEDKTRDKREIIKIIIMFIMCIILTLIAIYQPKTKDKYHNIIISNQETQTKLLQTINGQLVDINKNLNNITIEYED